MVGRKRRKKLQQDSLLLEDCTIELPLHQVNEDDTEEGSFASILNESFVMLCCYLDCWYSVSTHDELISNGEEKEGAIVMSTYEDLEGDAETRECIPRMVSTRTPH
ncbi:hypothetical protein MUK42_32606 [Musa troglodytarum]|uniref:Uncharacterized protein n=1 Tax=Musa troglodytarum TaxID=320322 RepID=A0A9E7FSN7_9LILI|nr:hypothetical protein MUK42_32606 [Musa troglodytarum]